MTFRDTQFSTRHDEMHLLRATSIDTPLGPMHAIADEEVLYLLEFADCRGLEREIERLQYKMRSTILSGSTNPLCSIQEELCQYFKGELKLFKTPFKMLGTPFQKRVWEELQQIPLGQTRSYLAVAKSIQKPLACRAVAQANGANQLAIIIPCHRVINANGDLGGYGGSIARKKWLLNHEGNNEWK